MNDNNSIVVSLLHCRQDDAHIFCEESQISEEIKGVLAFLEKVYGIFGFTFDLELSTVRQRGHICEITKRIRSSRCLGVLASCS